MADDRLRKLSRAAAQGDVAARAAHLLERVRCGELSEDRLRLAAYLGDEAACAALGGSASVAPPPADLGSFLRGLRPWGREAWVRGALAAARASYRWRGWEDPDPVAAAAAWAECPCDGHVEAATALLSPFASRPGEAPFTPLARAVASLEDRHSLSAVSFLVHDALAVAREGGEQAPEARLGAAVVAALVPWALREEDTDSAP